VQDSRKAQGPELFKASTLILAALFVVCSIAVAASTRLGMMSTFLTCLAFLGVGLSSDQVIRPYAQEGNYWARTLYPLVPNFQFFWMIDALSDERVIPWTFVASSYGYAIVLSAGFVVLGMALFETREVG